eukprot:1141358-Pelagomonas_calceolata.AAC.1
MQSQCTRVMISISAFNGMSGRGMGSIDSPTHTQKDCVESDLSALKLLAQFCLAGLVLLLHHDISYCGVPDVRGE